MTNPDDRDRDGAQRENDDAGGSMSNVSLSEALACIATHGHTERAEEIREFEGLDKEEVYGL